MSIVLHEAKTMLETTPAIFTMIATATGLFIYRSVIVRESDPMMQRAMKEVERRGLVLEGVDTVLDPDMMFGEAIAMRYGELGRYLTSNDDSPE